MAVHELSSQERRTDKAVADMSCGDGISRIDSSYISMSALATAALAMTAHPMTAHAATSSCCDSSCDDNCFMVSPPAVILFLSPFFFFCDRCAGPEQTSWRARFVFLICMPHDDIMTTRQPSFL